MTAEQERIPASVLMIYALAAVGGVVAYAPLLTLLLPIKVEMLGNAQRYDILAWCGIAGAVAAALANIAFGQLGDRAVARGGGRRGWLLSGGIATIASFVGVALAHNAATIITAVVLFQIAVNVVLAQVGALIAEEIPATQKGVIGALLTLGAPIAAGISAMVVTIVEREGWRLTVVATTMAACLLPLTIVRTRRASPVEVPSSARVAMRRDLAVAWMARLFVQIAASGVGLYLLFYFEMLAGAQTGTPMMVARLLVVATVVPVPIALLLGRWSDHIARRKPILAGAAMLATLGLLGMASAGSWTAGAIAYTAFASGVAIFLALNTSHAMLLLPNPARRGRDLGILNLTNTLPQVVAPLLAWWSTIAHGFGAAMAVLAVLTLLAGIVPLMIGEDD